MNSTIVKDTKIVGIDDNRKTWGTEDYINAIKGSAVKVLVQVCNLIAEVREKFFSEKDTSKHWRRFCKEGLGITTQQADKYIRISQNVLPKMSEDDAENYGVRKLNLIAALDSEEVITDVVESVNPDMTEKEIKNTIKDREIKNLPADYIPPKTSAKKIKKMMEKLDFAIAEWLPSENDPDGKENFKDFSLDISNEAWDLYQRIREVIESSGLFTMEHKGEKL